MAWEFSFGLDFGTSKTVLTWVTTDAITPNVLDVKIAGKARVTTCVLHVDKEVHIGEPAYNEYVRARTAGKPINFRANFKPRIHQHEKDWNAALDFLTKLRN